MQNEFKNRIRSYIDENKSIFIEVSDRIWENPELSLQEFQAAALYKEVLRKNGFQVEENICGIETAFSGSYGHGRPVIGFLGEFDALSGMSQKRGVTDPDPAVPGGPGHGCGHNLLGAGSLAAAFAVKDYLEHSGKEGTVIFFGCPGEEGGASKAFMARDGIWRSLDAALSWHPKDVNEVVSGTNNSSIQVLYKFHGTAAHAAGDPENGRSALDAVELMNTGVQYLREHMTSDCRVHYAITDAGGISPNVVQANASVLYMVRANKVKDSTVLLKRVDRIAEGAALMTETTFERIFIDGTAELVPNFALEDLLWKNFQENGAWDFSPEEWEFAERIKKWCPDTSTPGAASAFSPEIEKKVREWSGNGSKALCDYLIPLYHHTGFVAGSTDVGDVSWQVPTAQIHTAAFVCGAPGHSWQNTACGAGSIGIRAMLEAGKILACSAAELYEDPNLLERAAEEFRERTAGGYVCPIEPDAVPVVI